MKKLLLGTLIALIALGAFGSVALAQEPRQTDHRRVRGLGKVTAVDLGAGTLNVQNRRGTFEVLTDDETVFRIRGVENPSLSDIKVDDIVAGQVKKSADDGTLIAKVIAVVPPKEDRLRGLGKVTAVDLGAGTLIVQNRRGTVEILTNDETVFRVRGVENPSLDDIKVDDFVAGQVIKSTDDDALLAKVIAVLPPRHQDTP